jgi:5-formyltetrahydrofolate cyclo-ligase
MTDRTAQKTALRECMKARRATLDPALGHLLAAHVLESGLVPEGAVVAGYWPLPGEIDILPLLEALHGRGHRLALPETPPLGSPLVFRAWTPGDVLVKGRFGTMVSTGAMVTPEVILVPLLAFDARGNRLGFGGGYYDRTLGLFGSALCIGCGFAAQEVEAVPVEATDLRMDAVATELRVVKVPGSGV